MRRSIPAVVLPMALGLSTGCATAGAVSGPLSRATWLMTDTPSILHTEMYLRALPRDSLGAAWFSTGTGPSPFGSVRLPNGDRKAIEGQLNRLMDTIYRQAVELRAASETSAAIPARSNRPLRPIPVRLEPAAAIGSQCGERLDGSDAHIAIPEPALANLAFQLLARSLTEARRNHDFNGMPLRDLVSYLSELDVIRARANEIDVPFMPDELAMRLGPYSDSTRDTIKVALEALEQRTRSGGDEPADAWETLRRTLRAKDLDRARRWEKAVAGIPESVDREVEGMMPKLSDAVQVSTSFELEYTRALIFILSHEAYHLWFRPCAISPDVERSADAFASMVYIQFAQSADLKKMLTVMSDAVAEHAPPMSGVTKDLFDDDDMLESFVGRPIPAILRQVYGDAYPDGTYHGSLAARLTSIESEATWDYRSFIRGVNEALANAQGSLDAAIASVSGLIFERPPPHERKK